MRLSQPSTSIRGDAETGLTALLGQHFGDGLVYLQGSGDRLLLRRAIGMGLVSQEGYLTSSGYRFWLGHQR